MRKLILNTLLFALPTLLAWQCVSAYSNITYYRSRLTEQQEANEVLTTTLLKAKKQSALVQTSVLEEGAMLRFRSTADETWTEDVGKALAVLRQQREGKPQRVCQPPPPYANNGADFPELMDDAEYSGLLRKKAALWNHIKYRTLLAPLTEMQRDKVCDLLADRDMLELDLKSLKFKKGDRFWSSLRKEDADVIEVEANKIKQEIFAAAGSQIGGEILTAFTEHTPASLTPYSGHTSELCVRLSYSASPLSAEQAASVEAVMKDWYDEQVARKTRPMYNNFYQDELVTRCAKILNAEQLEGLRELQRQQQAALKRSQLPKT